MSNIQIFNHPQFGDIRTAGTPEEPLFCLADVCSALDLRQGDVVRRLEDGVVSTQPILDRLGRNQSANFVNEDGLYDVILDSRKPEAKVFRKWVTSEVLPSIRKTGSYTLKEISRKELARMIIQQEEEMEVLRLEKQEMTTKIENDAPKVVFADAIVGSRSSCLIGELAKIMQQNGVNIGQNRLFAWMREHHYLGTVGEYYNIPCQRYLEQGLFELKKNVYSRNGELVTKITPKVTGKGQQYFINLFLNLKKKLAV